MSIHRRLLQIISVIVILTATSSDLQLPSASIQEKDGITRQLKPETGKASFIDPERESTQAASEVSGKSSSVPASDAAKLDPGTSVTADEPVMAREFHGNLRNLPQIKSTHPREEDRPPTPYMMDKRKPVSSEVTSSVQTQILEPNMPSPATSFKGLDLLNWGFGWPPDPVGDVGPNHYVQAVNTSIGIFNKNGTLLSAFAFDSFWSGAGTGTACDTSNMGDPLVLYDALADRWIFADFAWDWLSGSGPYYECFAVSKTSDPIAGGWWLYAIRTDDSNHPWLADYPKMGLWPDGVYMSANRFDSSENFKGIRVWAFNRSQMESGGPVQMYHADLPFIDKNHPYYFSLLPSNLRGSLPPSGTPNYFVSNDLKNWGLDVWKFHVDWNTPANTAFTGPTFVTIASYTLPPDTIPQPEVSERLSSLTDMLMMQNQYRNIGGTESLWLTHTAGSGGVTGIRWYQLNVTGGTVANMPVQYSIFQPDGTYRWLPSLAVNKMGDMAVGYSVSSGSTYPGIRYAGRLATDPLNTLGLGEAILVNGTGAQDGGSGRWGDYSAMSVDPVDDCTFWYTNEYYESTGFNWQTRIGSFQFPSCSHTISGNLEVGDVSLSYTDGTAKTATSLPNGSYSFPVSSHWSGTVTPSHACYTFSPTGRSYSNVVTNQIAQNYAPTFNLASGCADINVLIAGANQGRYGLPVGASTRQSFVGVSNGPVKIFSTNNTPITGAERVIYTVGGIPVSFTEMMGLPNSQLDTTYWFPWYNNVDLDTQLRFGNVSGSTAHIDVSINGALIDSFMLGAGQSTRVSYAGMNNGPVKVHSDVSIIAAERVIYIVNGKPTSFSEMIGLSDGQLNTTYWMPWYNNVDLDTQLRFGNVSGTDAHVHVFIGGAEMTSNGSPFTLAPGASLRKSFAGVNNGPVKIESDVNIVAAERVIYTVNGVPTSFSEMMGLPDSQLNTTYWMPWYNNVDLDTQLRFGNVSSSTAHVDVYINGSLMPGSPFTIGAGHSTRVSYSGLNNGPVKVHSDVPIVAAERVIYRFGGIPISFTEMMGLPNSLLNIIYWMPWYNNVDLDTQLRFGVP